MIHSGSPWNAGNIDPMVVRSEASDGPGPTGAGHGCDAGLVRAFDFLGKRWNGVILGSLSTGPIGYAELRRSVGSITDSVLSDRLTELTGAGLIVRTVTATRPPGGDLWTHGGRIGVAAHPPRTGRMGGPTSDHGPRRRIRVARVSRRVERWWASGSMTRVSAPGGASFELFVRVRGEGPPVTLLHGYPSSSFDWRAVSGQLEPEWQVITMDLLGFGRSEKPWPHAYAIVEQSDLVEQVWRGLGVESTHLVVHDYSTSIGQELVGRGHRRPARLRHVSERRRLPVAPPADGGAATPPGPGRGCVRSGDRRRHSSPPASDPRSGPGAGSGRHRRRHVVHGGPRRWTEAGGRSPPLHRRPGGQR